MKLARLTGTKLALGAVVLALPLAGCGGSFGQMTASIGASAAGMVGVGDPGEPIPVQIFVASTRRDQDSPEGGLHEQIALVTLPPGHRPGEVELPRIGGTDPQRHFALAQSRALETDEFSHELASHISGRVGAGRDILLFVHGFNTSLDEARFRLAQIVRDSHFAGVPVLFTWPSKANVFSYVSDKERATASRSALATVMRDLAAVPGVGRVHILAHSMGSWLSMEALHENAIAGHPDLDGALGEVMLAAPDIDLAVFRQQIGPLKGHARVSVLVSHDDRALNLSSKLAGDRPRLGALDPGKPGDASELEKLDVGVYDLSSFSNDLIGHGLFASAPAVIQSIGAQLAAPSSGKAAEMAGAAHLPPEVSRPVVGADLPAPG